ncbi:MAG: chemotaxis protein CheW [Pseudomonadota bacterium]
MQAAPTSVTPDPILSGAISSTGAGNQQFITFTLDAQEYGIDIMVVREIKGWTETTTIPNAPSYVRGVINLRGIIVPIFDLRTRFGMGQTNPSRMHVVIIVNTGTRTVGLLVDTVSDIITVAAGAIRPVPEMGMAADDRFLGGLVALDDRMVTLVSLDGLFTSDTAVLLAGAPADGTEIKTAA